jgi:hypothetical protein
VTVEGRMLSILRSFATEDGNDDERRRGLGGPADQRWLFDSAQPSGGALALQEVAGRQYLQAVEAGPHHWAKITLV